ncbi:hypothetical protein CEXT_729101 [Caerostris extrusa]|uniref:Uncharacterized protein n=1 Tax=Caerostris extrusa TaxID=172846 RepID=A0AAV4PEQ2_CAEEX|nr:hypothetical protein CEXT_729101 [Caerostris extrusa]
MVPPALLKSDRRIVCRGTTCPMRARRGRRKRRNAADSRTATAKKEQHLRSEMTTDHFYRSLLTLAVSRALVFRACVVCYLLMEGVVIHPG